MVDTTLTTQAPGPQRQSAATQASDKLDAQYQQFLTLLTAQISNQDPLKPMDSSQFVTQLAQLSQVEQGVATNRNLEGIMAALSEVSAQSDIAMIGHDVMVQTDRAQLSDAGFAGAYELAAGAEQVTVRILAEDGTVVRELQAGATAPGETHDIDWNRRDAQGLPVPDGILRFEVMAVDAEGAPVATQTFARSTVEGLTFTQNGPELHLSNGERVSSLAVRSVL